MGYLAYLLLLAVAIILVVEYRLIRTNRWFNLKKNNTMPTSNITIDIDWSGSAYQYAPKNITIASTEDWQAQAAATLLLVLTTMEKVITDTVELVPDATTPETNGRVLVNGTDNYSYTVRGVTTIADAEPA